MASLLLLHGFTGAPSSWAAVTAALAQDVDVLAPPLCGHGDPPTAPHVDTFDDEIERLLGLLPTGFVHVAGYSLGARLALGLTLRAPSRVSHLTLISGRAGLASEAERSERRDVDERVAQQLERDGLEAFVRRWEDQALFATQRELPASAREAERARRLSHTAPGLARSLRATGLGSMPDYGPELGRLQQPVEVLAGARDSAFCTLGEAIVSKLPRARFTRVAEAGHNLLLERPTEVARAIARGLSR
ncbi:MAG: alpha/beta fold hydrolase [Polyangiaceae bacterium]